VFEKRFRPVQLCVSWISGHTEPVSYLARSGHRAIPLIPRLAINHSARPGGKPRIDLPDVCPRGLVEIKGAYIYSMRLPHHTSIRRA